MRLKVGVHDRFAEVVGRIEDGLGDDLVKNDLYADCLTIVDEFYANMVCHVSSAADDFYWLLDVDADGRAIHIQVQYPGPSFDPTQQKEIVEQAIEERPIGGLGLNIVHALSDTLEYRYQKGWNVINVQLNEINQAEDMD